jgi:hypothetical protein
MRTRIETDADCHPEIVANPLLRPEMSFAEHRVVEIAEEAHETVEAILAFNANPIRGGCQFVYSDKRLSA